MDMDDTLVMTGDADMKAYTDVVALAKQLHSQVCKPCCITGPFALAMNTHALSAILGDSTALAHHNV